MAHNHHPDRITYLALSIWQCCIWFSISFFIGSYFFPSLLPQPMRHDHHTDEQDTIPWTVATWTPTPIHDKSRIDQDLAHLVLQIRSSPEHSAPSLSDQEAEAKYSELCSVYSTHCQHTYWAWDYTRADKYLYQWLSIALLQHIDKRLTKWSVEETLSELKIYQDNTERRWSAGHTTIKINSEKIPTSREYREVLTHELWHTVDLGLLQWSSYIKNRSFTEFGKVIRAKNDPSLPFYTLSRISESTRKAEASFKDFVSWYAMKGVYEDFAETHNLRFNHNLLFQQLAQDNPILQKKYDYFKNIYTNSWFDDNPESAQKISLTKRPWDTTRIE